MNDPTPLSPAAAAAAGGAAPPGAGGPAGPGGPMGAPGQFGMLAGANGWSRWLPMITALAVAVTPIGVATITSQVALSSTNKDYVGLAISVLNSDKSTPAMRNWATNVLERLAPIPMESSTRRDFVTGGAALSSAPQQNCAANTITLPGAPKPGGGAPAAAAPLTPAPLARR